MPANIEIKASIRDFDELRRRAEALGDTGCEVIIQEDTYFLVATGRLKLRILAPNRAQLIYYTRPDQAGPKLSTYHITETSDPEGLKKTLALAYGIRATIRKTRRLYHFGQTRIHLDEVEALGKFLELEVVLRPEQSEVEGRKIAEELMGNLGIEKCDLLEGSYMDLAEDKA